MQINTANTVKHVNITDGIESTAKENTNITGEIDTNLVTNAIDTHTNVAHEGKVPPDIVDASTIAAAKRLVFPWNGLSGSTLKIIAIVTMFIDHYAAVVIKRMLTQERWYTQELYDQYYLLRDIGRIAFPIYCFLLVEGYRHTRNVWKYTLRLVMFAFISEIPFDLALYFRLVDFDHQNVFFTLFLGLLTIRFMDLVWQKYQHTAMGWSAAVGVAFLGVLAADLLHTDYSGDGVLCIIIFFIFRSSRLWQTVGGTIGYVNLLDEPTATFAFIPIAAYNGKRGLNLKYLFYTFYPAHFLLLYLIGYVLVGW
jgi:hypothetical protein